MSVEIAVIAFVAVASIAGLAGLRRTVRSWASRRDRLDVLADVAAELGLERAATGWVGVSERVVIGLQLGGALDDDVAVTLENPRLDPALRIGPATTPAAPGTQPTGDPEHDRAVAMRGPADLVSALADAATRVRLAAAVRSGWRLAERAWSTHLGERDPDALVARIEDGLALARVTPHERRPPTLARIAKTDPLPAVRARALEVLCASATPEEARPALERAVSDPSPLVRREVAEHAPAALLARLVWQSGEPDEVLVPALARLAALDPAKAAPVVHDRAHALLALASGASSLAPQARDAVLRGADDDTLALLEEHGTAAARALVEAARADRQARLREAGARLIGGLVLVDDGVDGRLSLASRDPDA